MDRVGICCRLAMIAWAGLLAASQPSAAEETAEPPPLTLAESIRYALEHHPEIRSARARVREADFLVRQRHGERLPALALSGTMVRQGPILPAFQEGANPITPSERYNFGIAYRMPIFDSGLRSANERSARAAYSAEEQALEQLQDDVTLEVALAYYDVLRAQSLLQVAEARLANAREQLRVAEARFRADVAPRFDVVRAETEVRNAETEVIAARNGVELANANFNHALGRDVTTPVALAPVDEMPEVEIPLTTAVEAALQSRPLLRERNLRIQSALQDVRALRALNRPAVDWIAAYDRRTATGISSDYTWNIGMAVSFPFFDSGVTRSRVRQAEERVEQERASSERDRQLVELQVRQALLNLRNARERLASAQQELTLAEESLRIANVRYNAGVGTTVEVTDAQLAVARAATNLAHGKYDYLAALAQLEYATGVPTADLQARAIASDQSKQ